MDTDREMNGVDIHDVKGTNNKLKKSLKNPCVSFKYFCFKFLF